jgi:hypothetical protein
MRIKWVFPGSDRPHKSIRANLSATCEKACIGQAKRCAIQLTAHNRILITASASDSVTARSERSRTRPYSYGINRTARCPWHYTTFWDWIDHWQTLIAGILAFAAAFGTVVATMIIASRQIAGAGEEADRVTAATRHQTETTERLAHERVLNEVVALRKSFALELRLQITRALEVYVGLRGLGKSDQPITAKIVESRSRMPAPIIFSANAGKIGLLEGDAMDVLVVHAS